MRQEAETSAFDGSTQQPHLKLKGVQKTKMQLRKVWKGQRKKSKKLEARTGQETDALMLWVENQNLLNPM